MLRASHTLSAIVLASLAALAAPAHAQIAVTGTGTDLVDVNAGQDLWRFDFTITGQMATDSLYKMILTGDFGSPVNLSSGEFGQYGVALLNPFGLGWEYHFTDTGTTATTNSFAFAAVRGAGLLPNSSTSLSGIYQTGGAFGPSQFTPASLSMGAALAPVPEASTTAMLFAGLAAMGFMVRRRRQG